MLRHREFGFYYKSNDLSLIEHTLFTGELGVKWKYIYTNIKDFKLECKYSTKLSQNYGFPGKKKCPFCFESFSWNPPNLCPWLFLLKHIPFFENNHLTPAQPWRDALLSVRTCGISSDSSKQKLHTDHLWSRLSPERCCAWFCTVCFKSQHLLLIYNR